MNIGQFALIKKDMRSVTSNKQVFTVLLIVPIVLTIALPSIFVFVISFAPDAASDFQKLLDMLPAPNGEYSQQQQIFSLILNQIMPSFFLIIPIMASSVMAASSFVGEKEKHTLETLLYSPLSLGQLFQSKILAGFSVGMMISFSSFAAMLLVMELESFFLTGNLLLPAASWLAIMLLIAPAISLIAIAVTVRSSAKGTDYRRSTAAGSIPDFSDSRFAHRTIHGHYSNQRRTPLGSGYCSGSTCYIAYEEGCWKLHLRKTVEIRTPSKFNSKEPDA